MSLPDTVTKAPPEEERRLRMTYEEFLTWSDEDTHAEWVDGEVIIHMPPKTVHQDVAVFLASLLRFFVQFFRLGKILTAPYEMKIEPPTGPAREPDILFIGSENLGRITENKLEGPADLIVEIISDDSVSRDREKKFGEYQAAGVPEYWIIDPRPGKQSADFWLLDENGRYQPAAIEEGGVYRSTIIPGFWLRIDWLWADELPDLQRTFAEIVGPSRLMDVLQDMVDRDTDTSVSEESRGDV